MKAPLALVACCLLSVVAVPSSRAHAQTVMASAIGRSAPDSLGALRPGDMLRLKIWREPDFSGDFMIDESGQAVLPRLGKTAVSGMSTEQLKSRLEDQYREYLNNPSIEVTPLRQVAVLGAVRNPGVRFIFSRMPPPAWASATVHGPNGITPPEWPPAWHGWPNVRGTRRLWAFSMETASPISCPRGKARITLPVSAPL